MLFSDPFREFDALTENLFAGRRATLRSIPMDAYKTADTLVLAFEVPGVREDQLSLEIDRNTLTLTVDRPVEEVEGERLITERAYGMYRRQLSLGETLDTDNVEAKLDSGVLTLTIPVAERAKPRQIAISAADSTHQLESKDKAESSA